MQLEGEDDVDDDEVDLLEEMPIKEKTKMVVETPVLPSVEEDTQPPEPESFVGEEENMNVNVVSDSEKEEAPKDSKMEGVAEDSGSGGEDTKSEDADPIQTEQAATTQAAGEAMEPETAAPPKAKKGLSVRERKLIKKYGSLEAGQAAEEERKRAEEQKKVPSKPKSDAQPAQANAKRGKKTKTKRMAKKYADQAEEDRELAMLALHAGEKEKKKEKKKAPEISETEKEAAAQTMAILKKDAALVAEQLPEPVREILAKCVTVKSPGSDEEAVVRWDKFDADGLEQLQSLELGEEKIAAANRLLNLKESTRIDNFSASLAGIVRTIRKYGHKGIESQTNGEAEDGKRKTKAEKLAQKESWKQTLAEEGVVEDDLEEDAVDDTTELNKLTGKPHNDDLILFAIPVCAPYHTLSQYTYRVKLTPGNMKRGKASKQCVDMFLKDGQKSALSDRNKDLIKKAADHEWVQAICGDVKISAAGASKVMQKQKQKAKSKSKKKK
jgi:hypothetical protein